MQKDRVAGENEKKNKYKKILNLYDVINKPYSKVTIELKNDYNINEIKELLSNKGETKINLLIKDKNCKLSSHYKRTENLILIILSFKS